MFDQVKFVLLFFVAIRCYLNLTVLGECCPPYQIPLCKPDGTESKYSAAFCLDCTYPDNFCARGNCNIFGCNCDGGCRTGRCSQACASCGDPAKNNTAVPRYVRKVPLFTVHSIMRGDLNRDGLLSIAEASNWVSKYYDIPEQGLQTRIELMDTNKDGFLSRQEIDG